jgi:hyperosmotically inducible periplasmic protein
MNYKLATTLVIGALIVPVAAYAADNMAKDKPSTTERVKENIKDSVITTKIKARYAKDKLVSVKRISVDTDDKGVVTLSGHARSKAEENRAVKIAKDTKGVTEVRNQIQLTPVAAASSPEFKSGGSDSTSKAADSMAKSRSTDTRRSDQPIDDTWITTKVKAKMVEDKQVSVNTIHVKTLNGVVELSGTAKTMDESSKAVALARGVEGVKSVKNYIKVN